MGARQRHRIGGDRGHVQRERIQGQVVPSTCTRGFRQYPQQGVHVRILFGDSLLSQEEVTGSEENSSPQPNFEEYTYLHFHMR